ncbi:DNA-binding MarR family transcriptional regulator [Enterococcus sp. PF1-24]|uniref:MarR family winged helix-turn-helix transcriptional regulator n=1 Tax=unclassified Enterococcus TaxID=2608891 RepID=UPI0024772809|nr:MULTISPECIES: MarR family transcriptional regulator [unclassified Enterococcus]MDH6365310.1 DNA-binding MarR family transcriptional regulator [Enterococcus sp. PFB1-1]MDH6402434.1 DNA-binding MarR family transcriptional regulator [Enterococcus sp. PF1-24]
MNTAFLLLNTAKNLKYGLNRTLETYNITAQQWAVIQRLSQVANENITAQQLSQDLEMDKQTISEIVKRLESKQLLIREKNPNDRRAYQLKLSKIGIQALTQYQEVSQTVLEAFLSPLTAAEQAQLQKLLFKLQASDV